MQPAVLLGLLGATMVAGEWARRAVQHRGQRQALVFPVARHLSWMILGEKEGSVEGFSLLLEVLNFFSSLGDSLQLPAPPSDLEKTRGLPSPTRGASVFSYLGFPAVGREGASASRARCAPF